MTDGFDLIEDAMDGHTSDAGQAAIQAADVDLVSHEELVERAIEDMQAREERLREEYGNG